ncbi:VOC family protein [uncultured Aquitalea sp.]|uniref:VOC family protein n=1 Tax=uncultured Aquitalea sp. TaxID=540272 RepID=UPI0025EB018E|nr:VOC family protein [uncultured Aquitalea sp.]
MIASIDHIVLTTARLDACVAFYRDVLGMRLESFIGGTPPVERLALVFGAQKINLHVKGREFEPKAQLPTPGALDLCFIAAVPLEEAMRRLTEHGVAIEEGPVTRTGARGKIQSIYVRDPDLNLVEISVYL